MVVLASHRKRAPLSSNLRLLVEQWVVEQWVVEQWTVQ
jgi:hypothetical protein